MRRDAAPITSCIESGKLRPVCVTENAGGIRKPRFNAWTITITTTRRRRFHSMRTDEASRTRSAARLFLGVVRTRHARPHPHPARPHEDGIRTPIPLVYSREPYPVPAHSRIITSCEDACRVNPSCVLRPCRPDNPCPPPCRRSGLRPARPASIVEQPCLFACCGRAAAGGSVASAVSSAHLP